MLPLNTILYTKNGKEMTNAIVVECKADDVYVVTTDLGVTAAITAEDIADMFDVGPVANRSHPYFRNSIVPLTFRSSIAALIDGKKKVVGYGRHGDKRPSSAEACFDAKSDGEEFVVWLGRA